MNGNWEDDDGEDEAWEGDGDDRDELFACPECGAECHADAEGCHACGRWFTDADRSAAWRAGSTSERIKTLGLWLLAAAAAALLLRWLLA